jgi:hypothetical protein
MFVATFRPGYSCSHCNAPGGETGRHYDVPTCTGDLETSYLTEDGFLSPHFNVHETHVVEDVQVDLDTPCWSPSDGSNTDAGEGFEFIEDFPRAAGTPQAGMRKNTTFEKIRIENEQAQKSHWNPFNDQNEWELARWLMTTGVSQNNREAFLKLPIVSTYRQTHK